jgi:hypothetical protein
VVLSLKDFNTRISEYYLKYCINFYLYVSFIIILYFILFIKHLLNVLWRMQDCALLGYYAGNSGILSQMFRDNLFLWSLRMRSIGFPETSVRNCHYSLRNNPEERGSQLLRGGSLKSRSVYRCFYLLTYKYLWAWHQIIIRYKQWRSTVPPCA